MIKVFIYLKEIGLELQRIPRCVSSLLTLLHSVPTFYLLLISGGVDKHCGYMIQLK